MATSMFQVTVGTAAVKMCTVPPGTELILMSPTNTNSTYIGQTSRVTTTNGAPLPNGGGGGIHFVNPTSSSPFDVWAVTDAGTDTWGLVLITHTM